MEKYFKNKKIKTKFKEDIELHEIFLDKLAQKKEEEIGLSEKKLEVPLSQNILKGLYFAMISLIFILFAKTFYFQIIEGKNLSALAEGNKFIIYSIQASRGVIYDQEMNQLVFNRPAFDLICNKGDLPEDDFKKSESLKGISEIIKIDREELKKTIEESNSPQVLIVENLDHQTLILLETKIADFPGFLIKRSSIREYQDGKTSAHLIGYTGKISAQELNMFEGYSIADYVGRDGLEKSYEEILRRIPGKLQVEKDALGNPISNKIIQLPESGKSLVLWLDSDLQKKIEEVLERTLKNVGAQKAAAVALDPKTGGVLSLVSLPSFDNNLFSKGADVTALKSLLNDPQQPLFNRAISGQYPTGSTIKPLIASAALEEKIISPEDKINCQGVISVPNPWYPEQTWNYYDWKVHNWTAMRKAIAESCNVYFYTVGGGYKDLEGLGVTRIKKYLQLFGWGKETQIDLPGEEEGFIPDPAWKESHFADPQAKIWRVGDTYHLSIGQGDILVTPLQVTSAISAIANGGKLFKPQVVQKIVDSQGNLISEIQPQILKEDFIDPLNLQVVREGMREAVTYGTGQTLNYLPVEAATKTGTAETTKEEYYHHWVSVFAPYDDPQIVLTIMVENARGLHSVVLPAAREILEWYFTQD